MKMNFVCDFVRIDSINICGLYGNNIKHNYSNWDSEYKPQRI